MKLWKKYLLYAAYILVGVGLLYGLLQLILAGYSVSWTGFGERTLSDGDIVGEKTLWDWMELLIIPLVLALGAFFLNRSERAVERDAAEKRVVLEREIAKDRQEEVALQAYFDRMSDLLLKENIQNEKESYLAKIRTLTILRAVNGTRKSLVMQFLVDADLIAREKTIVELYGADLTFADLKNNFLENLNLNGVNLSNADLRNASLAGSSLKNANLGNANLEDTHLKDANFQEAKLSGANLVNAFMAKTELGLADLSNANLSGAKLWGASISLTILTDATLDNAELDKANLLMSLPTEMQLKSVKSLKGATMPDGTIHE